MSEFALPQRDYYNGFVAMQQARRKSKRVKFVPTEEQIESAKTRILGVVNRYRGCYYTSAGDASALAAEMVSQVYCRGGSLGKTSKDIRTTLTQAIVMLTESGQLDFRPEDGTCMTRGHTRPRRPHRDKFSGKGRPKSLRTA